MLRIPLARSVVISRAVARPTIAWQTAGPPSSLRFNSSKTQLAEEQRITRRAALDARDDLQKDWTMPIVSYEVMKQKSSQPREVCVFQIVSPAGRANTSQDAYIIDVREPDEVIQGSIPSAVNLPLSVLSSSLALSYAEFEKKHAFQRPEPNQEIIFYCRSGKRSATASDIAKRNGYTKSVLFVPRAAPAADGILSVFNYEGSWLDWVKREGKSPA
jgi:thiosulfate:glutathione sulfurtransferase